MNSIKSFIVKLQNSEDSIKKRWLIIMSGLAMIIIIAIWLVYLNNIMGNIEKRENKQSETAFWQVFKTGLGIVGNSIKEKTSDLFYKMMGEKTIIVE